ncbi:phosphoserine phosphatase SerB [Paraferrimonas sp. SM1919]|uniref:phosphoserine phosphatase SerB n=1 Tax=Paraferrimonas sp. SM1919 TaxID=2662263 RepID=UPI0013D69838|nr:phosphoserine phosphatase SerB [Paraferrimonas sp. SM1919]
MTQIQQWLTNPTSKATFAQLTLLPIEDAPEHFIFKRLLSYNSNAIETLLQQLSSEVAVKPLQPCGRCYGWRIALPQDVDLTWMVDQQTEVVCEDTLTASLSEPGLLLMDMDSTAITIECIDELALLAGVGQEVAAVTAQAMAGQLDFEQSLRQRVSKLKGADENFIKQLCSDLPLMPGIEAMVARLKQHGWIVAVASGGFVPFVEQLKQQLQLDAAFANHLDVGDGILLGTVSGQVVDANYKAQVLLKLAAQFNIKVGQTVAIGDGANDIPMIKQAAVGIAYHGKAALVDAADTAIQNLGLDSLPLLLED